MVNHLIKTKVTSITRPNRFNKWIVGGLENPYPLLYRAGLKNFPGGKILGTFLYLVSLKLLIDIFYSIGYTFSCYIKLRNNTYTISPVIDHKL